MILWTLRTWILGVLTWCVWMWLLMLLTVRFSMLKLIVVPLIEVGVKVMVLCGTVGSSGCGGRVVYMWVLSVVVMCSRLVKIFVVAILGLVLGFRIISGPLWQWCAANRMMPLARWTRVKVRLRGNVISLIEV